MRPRLSSIFTTSLSRFESGTVIRERLVTYADHVRKFEWPAKARGKSSDHVGDDLEELSTAVFQIEPQNLKELAHYQNALRLLTLIADNRGERIDSANGSVPLLLWFVLIVGGIITLGYPTFFVASNHLAHCARRALAAACARLDCPFTGDEKISVLPFEAALERMPPALPSH